MSSHSPIFISGFMGAGKTTVAEALARILKRVAADLDQIITAKEGLSPKEIIERHGEEAFREVETRILREVLDEGVVGVVALGGGAWTLRRNRELIHQRNGIGVWLDAPFELCWRRILAAGSERPLVPSEQQARVLFLKRTPLYELASLRVEAKEDKSAEEIALAIVTALDAKQA
jgi:shikimate kinase